MTAAVLPLLSSPLLTEWERVIRAVRLAVSVGTTFRIAGNGIHIENLINERLHAELDELAQSGLLRSFLLSGDDPDAEALAFADKLGVGRVLAQTREEARAAVRRLIRDIREQDGHLGVDIETAPKPGQGVPRPAIAFNQDGTPSEHQPQWKERAGLDPQRAEIALLQLYAGGETAFIFRGSALRLVLASHWLRRQRLVVHNATFETAFIQHHAAYRRPSDRKRNGARVDCTMQAVGLVHGVGFHGEGRSLEHAAERVLGLAVPKALQVSDWGAAELSAGQIAYAAVDAIIAWRLWKNLEPQLKRVQHTRGGRWRHWDAYELQRRAIPAVAAMELRGLGFDRDEHRRQTQGWAEALADARHTFVELTGEAPPKSQIEKQKWLAQVLAEHPEHFPVWPRTATGLLSTRTGQLKRLIAIDTVRAMLTIRACEQLLNNFGSRLAEHVSPVTGRLHGRYNIAATKAGRFSSSSPNLQQLPRRRAVDFPRCIVARRGRVLVGCDWSQVELRAAAWLYHDAALTRVFAEGRDIHRETAAFIAGVPLAGVTPEQRDKAKPVNYGAVYGQGPAGLRESAFVNYGVEFSLAEAERARDRFFAAFPQLQQGLRDNYWLCKNRGYILIGAGRIVRAEWEIDVGGKLLFTRCCNLPVQGSASDAMLHAIALTHARLKAARIRGGLVLTAHDELLAEVDDDDAEKARQLLEQSMRDAFCETFPGAPTDGVAVAHIGNNWAEAKG